MRKVVQAAGGIVYRLNSTQQFASPQSLAMQQSLSATQQSPATTQLFSSAQPLTYQQELDSLEVCLVHRPKYNDWSFPKGKLDRNESLRHAAVREIGEETGISVELGPYLGQVEYPINQEGKAKRRSKDRTLGAKEVHYWMARTISNDDAEAMLDAFGPVHRADIGEIDDIVWVSMRRARTMLTHTTDIDMLAAFKARVLEGATHAQSVLIVRHGKAEPRKEWKGSDENRPITPRGMAAAYALDRELACYNPMILATSPWIRCQQTLQVLSWQTNRTMSHIDQLTEDAYASNPESSWQAVLTLMQQAVQSRHNVAICMHRPVIGGLFEHLRPLCTSSTLASQLNHHSPYMPTGSAVIVYIVPEQRYERLKIIDIQKAVPIVH